MCAKYYAFRYMFLKMHLIKVGAFAWYSIKIRVIFCIRLERRKVERQTSMKTETCKLYSKVFSIFLPKSSKASLIISSYTVSKLVHFLRHSVYVFDKHSLYADKFTRLFYLLIQLVQAANFMVSGVGGDFSQTLKYRPLHADKLKTKSLCILLLM